MDNPTAFDSNLNEVDRLRQVKQELSERLRQQAAVAALGQSALSNKDLASLMEEAAQLVATTLGVELCKILQLTPDGKELLLKASVGMKKGAYGKSKVGSGYQSQSGFTLQSGQPVIVDDLHTETRFAASSLLLEHHAVSGISVIIPGEVRPYGILGAHTTSPRKFMPEDAHFLQSVANVLASAIERVRAEDALRSSRDQTAAILSGIADGVTAQDPSGRLVYANHTAAQTIGFSSVEELLSASLEDVWKRIEALDENGDSFPRDRLPGRLALQGIHDSAATIRFRLSGSGEDHWSLVRATPIWDQNRQVELVVNIFHDITELKQTEKRQHFLVEAGKILSSSLDVDATLINVAQLAVTGLADWCSVHVIGEDETLRQLAVAHADPQKVELARELQRRYPPQIDAPGGVYQVVRTGQPQFYPDFPDEFLAERARDAGHLTLMRNLGLKSAIIMPLVARGRTLGAITLVWAESGRFYSAHDIALVEELAHRAALAIDNARLYRSAQDLNDELEQRVNKRTNQLQTLVVKLRNEILERKRAEDALRKSETLLHSFFEAAPDAMVITDQNENIVYVSAQTEEMFGYSREELQGRTFDYLLPSRFQANNLFQSAAMSGEVGPRTMDSGLEMYGRRRDSSEFPVDIMLSPVKTEEGLLVIGAVRDITERKQIEAELAEVQSRLIESVEAERLHIAQELHDGPIQDLYGLTFQLAGMVGPDAAIDKEMQDNLAMAKETAQHVIEVLRATCGELRPPTLTPFGLEKAILAHIERIRETYPELEIFTDLAQDGQLLPERTRLALFRVYQHAVSNVVRHASASQVLIRFALDTERVELEISDNGCGFDLPSRWVELARKGHLGLVGTAERVQAIGGRLAIKSAPGRGTQIYVSAPLELAQADHLMTP